MTRGRDELVRKPVQVGGGTRLLFRCRELRLHLRRAPVGGLARLLRHPAGMRLTPHTQVENLANLLAVRRRQALARGRRDQAYCRLVATVLEAPIDAVGASPGPPALLRAEARSLHTRQGQAA